MNKFFVFFIVTLLTFNISFANEENFIDGFEDIPMITGMRQETNNDIFFNNEETRYIETNLYAYKPITYEEFANFYTKTLPQLGWTVKEKSQNLIRFSRENDILDFKIIKKSPLKILISMKNRY